MVKWGYLRLICFIEKVKEKCSNSKIKSLQAPFIHLVQRNGAKEKWRKILFDLTIDLDLVLEFICMKRSEPPNYSF